MWLLILHIINTQSLLFDFILYAGDIVNFVVFLDLRLEGEYVGNLELISTIFFGEFGTCKLSIGIGYSSLMAENVDLLFFLSWTLRIMI